MTLDEFNARQNEILERLPPELHAPISWLAYEQGHAHGYREVLIDLEEIVDNLEVPIRTYGRRMESLGREHAGA